MKHERELWKEVVERRQQQPLQLALSMKEPPGSFVFSELSFFEGFNSADPCSWGKSVSHCRGGCFRGPLSPLLLSPQLEAKLLGLPAEASGAQCGRMEALRREGVQVCTGFSVAVKRA